jgi:hypothetical protein
VHLYSRLKTPGQAAKIRKEPNALIFEEIPATVFPKLFSDDEFENIREKCNDLAPSTNDRWDNRTVLDASPAYDGKPESTIEQSFKHIAKHLVAMWGSEACALYIQRLIVCDRRGKQGFPPHVMEDLIMLDHLNDELCKQKQIELAKKKEKP